MKFKKRGQSGGSAATLIIIITAIIILYVLFLPPEERALLLGETVDGEDPVHGGVFTPQILLSEQLGTLDFLSSDTRQFSLNSFNLNTRTEAQLVHSQNRIYIKNSIFDEQKGYVNFNVNPALARDLILSFNIGRGQGRLVIRLNDHTLYEGEARDSIPPIHIKQDLLESSNELEFSVSSPGIAFWRYNFYEINDLRIAGDITDVSASRASQTLTLSRSDIQRLESGRLRYLAVCEFGDVRNLEIKINSHSVFRGNPQCNILNHVSVNRNHLFEGTNDFEFSIEEGDVLITQLSLTNTLEMPKNPILYFDIDRRYFEEDEELGEVLIDNRRVELTITFPNPDRKRLELFINGRILGINTAQETFKRDISGFVKGGSNSIEIRPQQSMDITELRVDLR